MQKVCYFIFFKVMGWRSLGEPPTDVKKYLFVVVPHTSNWDFVYALLATKSLGLDVKFFVKDAYFIWPLGYLCRWLGLLPVNRRVSTSFVDTIAEKFDQADELHMLIAPEGTRKSVDSLKSGYYHMAQKSGAAIVVAGPNYEQKTFSILPARGPLASFDEDQQQIIEFAKTHVGKIPNNSFR